MARYSLDIQKQVGTEFFTNRYILELAAITDAATPAGIIWAAERAVMLNSVLLTSYRISSTIVGDDMYMIVPIGLNGQRAVGAGTELPLFNCARVDFAVTLGRPSRKYLRGILLEGDQENYGVLNTAIRSFINDNYADTLVNLAEYVDVDGQAIVGGATHPNVAMRQLRRGSRRRTEPIIPVS